MAASPADLLNQALQHHRAGQLAEAEALYRQVLQAEPGNAEALHLCGLVAYQGGRLAEAEGLLRQAVDANPAHPHYFNNLGEVLRAGGRLAEAEACYRQALLRQPDYPDALNNLGVACQAQGRLDEAVGCFLQALSHAPGNVSALNNLGALYRHQGRAREAADCYGRALQFQPGHPDLLRGLGWASLEIEDWRQVESAFGQLLRQQPGDAEACLCLGIACQHQGRADEAEAYYRLALQANPQWPEAHFNLGTVLEKLGRRREAEAAYRQALELRPDYSDAWNNLGVLCQALRRFAEAGEAFSRALRLRSDYAEAFNNLGLLRQEEGKAAEAEGHYLDALRLKPDYVEAHYNLGNLRQEQGRVQEAAQCYREALRLNPAFHAAKSPLLHMRQHLCDWSGFDADAAEVRRLVREEAGARVMPFVFLALPGATAAEQRLCAEQWARLRFGALREATAASPFAYPPRGAGRLRLGYLTADMREHPVAHLVVEVIEQHDRERFEVIGYSCGPDDGSAMGERMRRAFDRWADIQAVPSEEAARLIHADGIDLLIDLTGYTQFGRSEILAWRPAPVQVNWLGYTGTLGTDFVDWLICDRVVAPPEQAPFYAEKLAYLPDVFQSNSRRQEVGPAMTRADCGLPAEGVVFCCFNQSYKIAPEVFDGWCRLLNDVPGSVLWLLATNPDAEANLRREAAQRGVAGERLVFAPRVPRPQHMARLPLADLFLDTRPYNAHASASDALWSGVPVVTCLGDTFPSRVAASLLGAVEMPELVADSPEAYLQLAKRLATRPEELAALRRKLAANKLSTPLFDSQRFTRNLEKLYREMWDSSAR